MQVIAGIDPGTTSALAAIDFSGNVVAVTSGRHVGLAGIIEALVAVGRPALLATDKAKPPQLLAKLAAQYRCPLFSPVEDLTQELKLQLTRGYPTEDGHQRDALAAALFAWRCHQNKIKKLLARGVPEEAIAAVLAGSPLARSLQEVEGEDEAAGTGRPTPPAEPPHAVPPCAPLSDSTPPAISSPQRPPHPAHHGPQSRPVTSRACSSPSPITQRLVRLQEENRELRARLKEAEDHARQAQEQLLAERRRYLTGAMERQAVERLERHVRRLQDRLQEREGLAVQLTQLKELMRRVAEGELRLVGSYPQAVGGLSALPGPLHKKDAPDPAAYALVFTDHEGSRRRLQDAGVKVASAVVLFEAAGMWFVRTEDLKRKTVQGPRVDLQGLVEEYRARRE